MPGNYNYGSKNGTVHTLADYIQSIQEQYSKPDPIEEEVNISNYESPLPNRLGFMGEKCPTAEVDFDLSEFISDHNHSSKKFSHERFNEIAARTWRCIKSLSELKGGEYAGDVDRLANFRGQAEELGVPMEMIWAVYANKHWAALMQYVKDIKDNKERARLEPITGRLDDIIVYCMLMKAMVEEREEK